MSSVKLSNNVTEELPLQELLDEMESALSIKQNSADELLSGDCLMIMDSDCFSAVKTPILPAPSAKPKLSFHNLV